LQEAGFTGLLFSFPPSLLFEAREAGTRSTVDIDPKPRTLSSLVAGSSIFVDFSSFHFLAQHRIVAPV
jgi:hypothetical protein